MLSGQSTTYRETTYREIPLVSRTKENIRMKAQPLISRVVNIWELAVSGCDGTLGVLLGKKEDEGMEEAHA